MALLNVDIDLLRTFLTVLETQSFTRTAELLLRTQPAISQQMKKLEDTVGAPLIARDRNRITPTTTGLVVKSYAQGIIGLNDRMIADLIDSAPPVLRIGLPDDYAAVFLPEILRLAAERLPNTEISCHAGLSLTLARQVAKGELDLAILTADPDRPCLHVINEPLVWVAASGFDATQRPLPLATFHDGCTIRQSGLATLQDHYIPVRISHSSNANTMIITAISGGHAMGVMPACTARHAGLRTITDAALPPLPDISIALQIRDQASPAIRKLALAAIEAVDPAMQQNGLTRHRA
ncbi:LysR family transcriptional regulator [Thalassospira sp.]|uniref:LysR family transcriptional regulator n=1 Tax=Thalassospira sp. TaxID=1912094 RepID=UPI0027331DC8|nr:LysR family transcriptional regulator [Thalassospira sp.]MDP2696828.1 LysR family transcriptional regulator [Thalassospira sp.]